MLRNAYFSAGLASLYLVIYCVLLQLEKTRDYAVIMFLFAPFVICWMVYTVLKYDTYKGKGLTEEEFGYQDKNKSDLGMF
jgi:hypothetical protein